MKITYAHTNLIAQDWKKLSNFYIEVFDCKPEPPERALAGIWLDELTGIESAHIKGIHLSLPGFEQPGPTLEIFQYNQTIEDSDKRINKEGFRHIAFSVDDVEACLDRLIKNGGTTVGQVVKGHVAGVGEIHVVYARDPEGNIIEIQKWG